MDIGGIQFDCVSIQDVPSVLAIFYQSLPKHFVTRAQEAQKHDFDNKQTYCDDKLPLLIFNSLNFMCL
jgi:hypothetical protein